MKNKTLIIVLTIFIGFATFSCGKDDEGGDFFIPILENQWFNRDNPNDLFNISAPAQEGVNESTFSGTEDSTDSNGNLIASYSFNGSFTNHNIQFTYELGSGVKTGKTFSGTINDASTEMTLFNSDLGNLVLKKP